jgi:hypothetical protein
MKKYKILLGYLILVLGNAAILVAEKLFITVPFSIDRFIILSAGVAFLSIHFILDYKLIWDFIYRKRYFIGIFILLFFVINGYHGSSIGAYSDYIQPDITVKDAKPFWGVYRPIRSDELVVDTPTILSQINHNRDLDIVNDALMAKNTTVVMFPQAPTRSISILISPRLLGFLFLDVEQAYSLYWYLPLFALFFSLFELFMIMTKGKKIYSLFGTMMLVFSPSMQWWNSTLFLLYGTLAFHMFRNFLISTTWKQKLLFSLMLGWFGSCFIMIMYPAWQIPYGYMFLGLFIWQVVVNWKKLSPYDLIYIIPAIGVICVLVIPTILASIDQLKLTMNTVYPGARDALGGNNWEYYYNYLPSIFYSIKGIENPCEFSQYIILYPLPIILGVWQIIKNIKNKNHDLLLNILVGITFVLNLWNYVSLPFRRITLLYMAPAGRSAIVVGVMCVIIMVLLISKYERKKVKEINYVIAAIVSYLTVTFGLQIVNKLYPLYMTDNKNFIAGIIFFALSFAFVLNAKKYNKYFIGILFAISVFIFVTVNPFTRGLSVMFEKPFSKEVQKIVEKDNDAVWLSSNSELYMASYVLANGARVINSTNYHPNIELWKKLDKDGKYNNIYNRYSHLLVDLTNDNTTMELIQADLIRLHLNTSDVCKLNIDYIATTTDLTTLYLTNIYLEQIYSESNTRIYKVNCNGSGV